MIKLLSKRKKNLFVREFIKNKVKNDNIASLVSRIFSHVKVPLHFYNVETINEWV